MTAVASARRPWVALLLSLLCTGVGHGYAGRPVPALALYVARLALGVTAAFALGAGFGVASIAFAAIFAFWIAQAVLAWRAAGSPASGHRRWFSRPLGIAALVVAGLLVDGALTTALAPYRPRAWYMPSGSMIPTLLPGDYFVAVPRGRVERGAVVVHQPPPGTPRRDPIVKRVVGVAGDTVQVWDGHLVLNGEPAAVSRAANPCAYADRPEGGAWREEPCVDFVEGDGDGAYHTYCTPFLPCGDVPASEVGREHVYVLGDHRDHSADSRVYGPISEDAILGRVSYVYFSVGPSGIRWDRVGKAVR